VFPGDTLPKGSPALPGGHIARSPAPRFAGIPAAKNDLHCPVYDKEL